MIDQEYEELPQVQTVLFNFHVKKLYTDEQHRPTRD